MRTIEKQRAEYKAGKLAGVIDQKMTFKAYVANLTSLKQEAVETEVTTVVAKIEEAVVVVKVTKAGQAREMFKQALAEAEKTETTISRKTIMDRFINELHMSKAGANTYYQNLRDEFHLSSKTKVTG